ncbi:MAG: divalent metal cation transporter, partial [Thermoguttaceae bacterium]
RKLEAFILALVLTIGLCFLIEIFLCKPSIGGIAGGFVPHTLSGLELYIAIGIIGATVMPHNLYLHSALVQSRDVTRSRKAVTDACKYNLIDSSIAMNCAFFVNAAILIVAAATFWANNKEVTEIQQAHALLEQTLGTQIAPIAFALALLCAGQSSTITGTLAGQITMEGFLRFRIRPWLRRLITRTMAIVPAVLVIFWAGEKGLYQLLILSQVILSLQLAFAVVPLVRFTSSKRKMGPFANPWWLQILAWLVTAIIALLNGKLVYEALGSWLETSGNWYWLIVLVAVPISLGLSVLLVWMTFRREKPVMEEPEVSAEQVLSEAAKIERRFKRIGVALEAKPTDASMLAEAVSLAKSHHAELLLMHVVDGVGGTWYGIQTGDSESREDEIYLEALVHRLRSELRAEDVPTVDAVLGYGDPSTELVNIAREKDVDLVVMGGHGHRGLLDLVYGQTISTVRHDLKIPIVTVRGPTKG